MASNTVLPKADVADALNRLGWGTTPVAVAVKHFQRGWNLGPALTVDGIPGPKTSAALTVSLSNLKARKGTASEHFSFTEFACRCKVACPGGRIWVDRRLLVALEKLRAKHYPSGLLIASGCRDVDHNTTVGGAEESQHLTGLAADIAPLVPAADIIRLGLFSGVGAQGTMDGRVRHVDIRHIRNKPGQKTPSVTAPARWHY